MHFRYTTLAFNLSCSVLKVTPFLSDKNESSINVPLERVARSFPNNVDHSLLGASIEVRVCKPGSERRLCRMSTLLFISGKSAYQLTPISSICDSPGWESRRYPACWGCRHSVRASIRCWGLPGCEGLNAITNTIRVVTVTKDVIYVVDNMIVRLGPDCEILYRHISRKCQVICYQVQRRSLYSICDRAYIIISILDFAEGNHPSYRRNF